MTMLHHKTIVSTPAGLLNGHPAKPKPADADADAHPARSFRDVCLEMREKVEAFLSGDFDTSPPSSSSSLPPSLLRNVQTQLRISMGVVEEALDRYPLDQIALSYNGGKDCLVLLIMILAGLAHRLPSDTSDDSSPPSFPAVYIVSNHPFAEVDDFVASSSAEYHLDVTHYTMPMRRGLELYLADRPSVKAIFVGTRRTDPHGERLTYFDPTDEGWPSFMRVHPVINWHYAEIWAFIRHLSIPYCPLYDQGYTSLGGTRDTHPNPHLKRPDGGDFRPAYELMLDEEERLGRD